MQPVLEGTTAGVGRLRGHLILVVGPDGAGKTTLAGALAERLAARHDYWRPGLLPMPKRLLGRREPEGDVNPTPHAFPVNAQWRATARTVWYWVDFLAGWWGRYRWDLVRGRSVVVERGWLDLCVDPLRYRLPGVRLPSLLGRALPPADLLVVCAVPAPVANARKPELAVAEIERQYAAWATISWGYRQRLTVDASAPPQEAVRLVETALAQRSP